MKKAVFTVVVDNYEPELCAKTLPTIKAYADKMGAEHIIIGERKYPDFPPTYEKVQVHELGRGYDFCLLIDADVMVHPDAPDFTLGISPGYVGVLEAFNADRLFVQDEYFKKDGRNIGLSANFVLTDKITHDLWEPLDVSWEEARKLTKREFIIDEYCISHNLAKFGFKFTGLHFSDEVKKMFYHYGTTTS